MFDRIAPVYDVMNRVMTVGLDRRWRRLTVEAVVQPGCARARRLLRHGRSRDRGRAGGRDRHRASTSRARCSSGRGAKSTTIEWVQGDVLALPYGDASFDAATVGFGVRNVADLARGAASSCAASCVRAAGSAILEITQPRGALKPFFSLWFDRIVPLLGRVLPGGKAYTYLPASVRRFPGAEELAGLIDDAGFEATSFRLFGGTIVALHTATAR